MFRLIAAFGFSYVAFTLSLLLPFTTVLPQSRLLLIETSYNRAMEIISNTPIRAGSFPQVRLAPNVGGSTSDSLYASRVLRNSDGALMKIDNAEWEQRLLLKESDLKEITQQRVVLTTILLLLAALGIINYKRYREKRRHAIELANKNKKIDRQYNLLKRTNEQNELLLREIHHRVKNNLQLAASLLNLQLRTTDHEEARAALRESASRLYSMLLVHQELYGRSHLGEINMDSYTHNLTEYLLQSYGSTGYEVIPTIQVENDIRLKTDIAIPLGLMMTELITNSLKYARPADHLIYIEINLSQIDNNEYKLAYLDNGHGLPQDLDLKTSKTMGIRLLRDLTRQLKGTIEHTYQQSSFITITFKDI